MKVLRDNYSATKEKSKGYVYNPFPKKLICEKCNSELQYDEEDIHIGVYGASHVLCPLCDHDNMIDDEKYNITLTKDNIEFPIHFSHTSVETGAVDNCNTEFVKKCVKEAIEYFRKNKDEFAYTTSTGTTTIHIFRYTGDKEYEVVVSKDYYSTYIPFESEDYGGEDRFQTITLGMEW